LLAILRGRSWVGRVDEAGLALVERGELRAADLERVLRRIDLAAEDGDLAPVVDIERIRGDVDGRLGIGLERAEGAGVFALAGLRVARGLALAAAVRAADQARVDAAGASRGLGRRGQPGRADRAVDRE